MRAGASIRRQILKGRSKRGARLPDLGLTSSLGLVDICLNCDSCSYVFGMIDGHGADRGFRSRESGELQSYSARRQPADVTFLAN